MVQILRILAAFAVLGASLAAQNIHWAQILSGDRQGSGAKGMSNALTSAHFFIGNGSNIATDVALSGDSSVTNAGAWTNVKLNGVAFAASPSTNTVPIITASNTATYSTVPDCQDSAGNHLNYNNSTHVLSCGTSGSGSSTALTSAHLLVGNVSNLATDVALSGDASVTNAGVWTNVKLNGVSFAASPSTNTVPIITASNTATYTSVPDCQDSSGNHLNYNNSTHALSCGTSTGSTLLASGIVDGQAPVTVTTGSSATLGGTYQSGYTFNEHATAATAITYTLPTAAAGRQYCVGNAYNGSAADTGTIELLTSASGQFIIFTDGTLSATGGYVISGGAAADFACVVGVDSTHWLLRTGSGAWTKH